MSRVDLKQLAIPRRGDERPDIVPPRRLVSRVVLPVMLILGFAGVLAWAARDTYLPRTPVRVVPVRISRAEIQTAGVPLFNAAGWIEPRPTPIRVAALASGVVEDLLVVEDQFVEKGEPVARLVDEDARLAVEQAEAELSLRESEVQRAEAALKAAEINLRIPAHLELPVAEAEAALAAVETELADLPHQKERAEARLRLADYDLKTVKSLSKRQAETQLRVEQAKSEFDKATAEVAELVRRQETLTRHRVALERQVAAAAKRLELKTDEQHGVEQARADLLGAKSRVRRARAALDEANLRLARMTIVAPVTGRILNLVAQPGSQLIGSMGTPGEDRSTVVKMYDPNQLQVRVDVRFQDLPQTGRDQPVEIRSPAVSEPLAGRVLFLTGFANIQKNTLEVKVSIDDPPDVLKPEMLVDVTFLAPEVREHGHSDEQDERPHRLFVPASLVESEGNADYVWVADLSQQIARRRRVTTVPASSPEYVEVTDGLTPASRLIAAGSEGLEDGGRIRVLGEDAQVGRASPVARPTSRLPDVSK